MSYTTNNTLFMNVVSSSDGYVTVYFVKLIEIVFHAKSESAW